MRVLRLDGSPRERGRAHGEELRADILTGVARWRESLVHASGRSDVDAYLGDFLAETRFADAVHRWTPTLWDEVEGIADGAALPHELIWAYQLMDEQWWFAGRTRAVPASEHCSSLGLRTSDGRSIVAQNMDLPGVYDGQQVLLRIAGRDGTPDVMAFSAAGMIGFDGLNAAGVAVCCNSLPMLPTAEDGLPVAFVLRGVLDTPSLADAVDFLRAIRHATGQNYVVGDGDGVDDLECAQDVTVPLGPTGGCVFHTNHVLAWDDGDRLNEHARATASTSFARLDTMAGVLGDVSHEGRPALEVDDVQALLARPPVSVAHAGEFATMTVGSLVMELGARSVLHLAPGPPETTPYVRHDF